MIDFRNAREPRASSFDYIRIRIASPEEIRGPKDPKERERLELQGLRTWWSWGEVTKPETINYRSFKPEKDGLFCERIFGPERDYECACGKYRGTKYKGIICDRCGVKVTHSRVRRKRMGHINLASPTVHIWFFKSMPSRLGTLLAMKTSDLEKVIYYQDYVVVDGGDTELKFKQMLTEDEHRQATEKYGNAFKALMGADAARELQRIEDAEHVVGHRGLEVWPGRSVAPAHAAQVGADDVPAGGGEDGDDRAPRVPVLRPAVEQDDGRAVRGAGLRDVEAHAVDVDVPVADPFDVGEGDESVGAGHQSSVTDTARRSLTRPRTSATIRARSAFLVAFAMASVSRRRWTLPVARLSFPLRTRTR